MSAASIAVLAPNWLGDAVMCLPALRGLRAAAPGAAIRVYARAAVAPVFGLAGLELDPVTLPPPPSLQIERARPEIAILFPNSFHSALLAWRMGARRRVGYRRDGRGWLLRPAIAPPPPGATPSHESFHYLELLRRAGLIAELPPADPAALRVPLRPDEAGVAAWRARLGEPTVALHAGATFGTAKRWPPARFAALARALADGGARVVLIGSRRERELAEDVRQEAARPGAIANLTGDTSLLELIALLAAVKLLVANDSGPMHLAGAVGTPVVALFGSTNERETCPLTEAGKLRLLKVPGIECSPCKLRDCPIDHRCMERLPVEEVLAAAKEFLHV